MATPATIFGSDLKAFFADDWASLVWTDEVADLTLVPESEPTSPSPITLPDGLSLGLEFDASVPHFLYGTHCGANAAHRLTYGIFRWDGPGSGSGLTLGGVVAGYGSLQTYVVTDPDNEYGCGAGRLVYWGGVSSAACSDASVCDGEYHTFAVVEDTGAGVATLYVDGVAQSTTGDCSATAAWDGNLLVSNVGLATVGFFTGRVARLGFVASSSAPSSGQLAALEAYLQSVISNLVTNDAAIATIATSGVAPTPETRNDVALATSAWTALAATAAAVASAQVAAIALTGDDVPAANVAGDAGAATSTWTGVAPDAVTTSDVAIATIATSGVSPTPETRNDVAIPTTAWNALAATAAAVASAQVAAIALTGDDVPAANVAGDAGAATSTWTGVAPDAVTTSDVAIATIATSGVSPTAAGAASAQVAASAHGGGDVPAANVAGDADAATSAWTGVAPGALTTSDAAIATSATSGVSPTADLRNDVAIPVTAWTAIEVDDGSDAASAESAWASPSPTAATATATTPASYGSHALGAIPRVEAAAELASAGWSGVAATSAMSSEAMTAVTVLAAVSPAGAATSSALQASLLAEALAPAGATSADAIPASSTWSALSIPTATTRAPALLAVATWQALEADGDIYRPPTTARIHIQGRRATVITIRGAAAVHINDVHDITIELMNAKTGRLEDPTALRVWVAPDGAPGRWFVYGTSDELVRLAEGRFRLSITITSLGRWIVAVDSPGPLAQGRDDYGFFVEPSAADHAPPAS